jgi:hypothetical protein
MLLSLGDAVTRGDVFERGPQTIAELTRAIYAAS